MAGVRRAQELAQNPACRNGPALLESMSQAHDKSSLINVLAKGTTDLEQARENLAEAKWALGSGWVARQPTPLLVRLGSIAGDAVRLLSLLPRPTRTSFLHC
jgi:hypothetical protein